MKLIDKEDYTNLDTDLKESNAVSNLMDDFPPICKEDPLDIRINFVLEHYQNTRETIKLDEIPDTMYGGALPVARKRKPKRRTTSKAYDLEEASEPKQKKAKVAPKVEAIGSESQCLKKNIHAHY